jgi:hypothetical protein
MILRSIVILVAMAASRAFALDHPRLPRNGQEAGGAGFLRAIRAPRTLTVPLRSGGNASSFWIILMLVSGRTDHSPIRVEAGAKIALRTKASVVITCLQVRGLLLERPFEFDTPRFESSLPSGRRRRSRFGTDKQAFVAGVSAAVFSISVFDIRDRFVDR